MTELPRSAAIVGGGTMGAGIATALTLAGVPCTVIVRREGALKEVSEAVAGRLERHLDLGLASAEQAAAAARRLGVRVGLDEPASYEVVLESIVEDRVAKRDVLARAERMLNPDGVLCTNTSSLPIAALAGALEEPRRLVGWHWFHPADLVALIEIVPGPDADPGAIGRVRGWSAGLGKEALVLGRDTPGFVANRLQYALLREAYALVASGVCDAAGADLAITAGLGPRWSAVGPFSSMDIAGLDIHAAVASALFPSLDCSTELPAPLVEARRSGALGIKNGRGLRGSYSDSDIAELVLARDRALAARRQASA